MVSADQPATAPGSGVDHPASGDVGGPDVAAETTASRTPAPRIDIVSPRLRGSISLRGGRLDDLVLEDYFDKIGEDAENIRLLNPVGDADAFFVEFGWIAPASAGVQLPDGETLWQADGNLLAPGQPLTLSYDNGAGLNFTRTFELDENFVFTVTNGVENSSPSGLPLTPYGLIVRQGNPDVMDFFVLHEGPLGVFNGTLDDNDLDYGDLEDEGNIQRKSTGGWLGIADKYWLTALVPDQEEAFTGHYRHRAQNGDDRYLVDYVLGERFLAAGGSISVTGRVFSGAKEVSVINNYAEVEGIQGFEMAIDWGWYPFLTKPIFWALSQLNKLVGNYGVAILLLTVFIKMVLFPLANKSYVAMSKMKKLQPKMAEIKERYADDKARQQQETMELYKKEKVNPLAGCLPVVVQIPVFFALYKTLFISIEMRHQPFFGWIQDLSAPDDFTVITLFGAVPWDAPAFLLVGLWPILMGATMFLQQKMNPQSPDPIQAKLFMFMPILFTFILAPFPAGLVIYWTWNNLLSIAQQWTIMRRMGVKIG
jgi:YidC/Oxa1 family membrane protein insertase